MKIFDGKKIADDILEQLRRKIKEEKIRPTLAVILVGSDEASRLYIKLKKEAAEKVGIDIKEYIFYSRADEEEIISQIKQFNDDSKINSIIVQLPLPATLNAGRVVESIDSQKDVDGFHKENRRLLEKGEAGLMPVLPMAIFTALREALKESFGDKKILALVNSEIFGQSLKIILEKAGGRLCYMVRKACVVLGVEKEVKSADVLISVCGCPNFIKGDMIKEGVVLIDGGITRWSDGKVVGDIDRESVKSKAVFLTPVPGGLGPLTVALLLKNVYLAAKKQIS